MHSLSPALSSRFTRTIHALAGAVAFIATAAVPTAVHAQTWYGTLRGTNEVPPNASTATGFVTMSLSGDMLSLSLNWSGLTGGAATAGHIHCCTAPGSNVGVAVGFTGLAAATSGSYTKMFDLTNPSVYTNAFITNFGGGTVAGSEAALIAGLNSGMAYVNLHNGAYPGGEIRANIVVTPEPASVAMFAFGLAGVGLVARKRRAH